MLNHSMNNSLYNVTSVNEGYIIAYSPHAFQDGRRVRESTKKRRLGCSAVFHATQGSQLDVRQAVHYGLK